MTSENPVNNLPHAIIIALGVEANGNKGRGAIESVINLPGDVTLHDAHIVLSLSLKIREAWVNPSILTWVNANFVDRSIPEQLFTEEKPSLILVNGRDFVYWAVRHKTHFPGVSFIEYFRFEQDEPVNYADFDHAEFIVMGS